MAAIKRAGTACPITAASCTRKMINGQTKIFGILGRPVAHSLSPVMHNAAFRHLGINAVYVAFPVTDLAQAVAGFRGLGIGGVSVTIPFKEEIIPLIDELDPRAARIGAVNTVVNRDGRLTGYNTDWLGAVTALTAKISLKGRHVLILGAGGASRAIAYGIIQAGGRVSLTDIDAARAAALARDLGAEAIPPEALERLPRHHPGERHPRGHDPGRGRDSHQPGPAGPLRGRHGHRLPALANPAAPGS